jgi:riboflavin transporter FmnP
MSKNVKRISLTAMLTALAVVLLYVSALLPTMRLALVVTAGLLTAVAILESGISAGIMLFAATSLLGLFVSPMRGTVLIYVLFFGYYRS